MEPLVGFEPTTCSLRMSCSTPELQRRDAGCGWDFYFIGGRMQAEFREALPDFRGRLEFPRGSARVCNDKHCAEAVAFDWLGGIDGTLRDIAIEEEGVLAAEVQEKPGEVP
jgi:hypothetical protein